MELPVRRRRRRLHPAEVLHAASAVEWGVAVERLAPEPASRNAQDIVRSRHRREVADNEQRATATPRLPHKADDARVGIVAVDPLEAGLVEIELMQRRLGAVEPVEVGDPAL